MPAVMSKAVSIISLIGAIYPPLVVETDVADRMYPLYDYYKHLLQETGYLHIHATKPETVGKYSLDTEAIFFCLWKDLSSSSFSDPYPTKWGRYNVFFVML
jgi:hypothetical protein